MHKYHDVNNNLVNLYSFSFRSFTEIQLKRKCRCMTTIGAIFKTCLPDEIEVDSCGPNLYNKFTERVCCKEKGSYKGRRWRHISNWLAMKRLKHG